MHDQIDPVLIERDLAETLRRDAAVFPVVTLVGPRQSGKSTLARAAFPSHAHVNLERPDRRQQATEDPRSLLAQVGRGAIIDEVQMAPELLSWIQADVDDDPTPGRFVLTGSNQHALSAAVAQSLAGRTSVLTLLPPDLTELQRFDAPPASLWSTLWTGAFPRIHDVGIAADRWLSSYVATYVERDVRQVLNVTDLVAFGTFVRLVAGRTAQEVNLAKLGADAGVTQPTARSWLSVLESSFLVARFPAHARNTPKQLVKTPKLHVLDSGLLAYLLGIRSPQEIVAHPLRGALFESWVAAELLKQRLHRGLTPRLSHWRESRGAEVDVVVEDGAVMWLVEVKSGSTVASDWFAALRHAVGEARAARPNVDVRGAIVYGGEEATERHGIRVVPWRNVAILGPRVSEGR